MREGANFSGLRSAGAGSEKGSGCVFPGAYAPIAVPRLLTSAQTELAGMPLNALAKTNEWHFDIANGTIRRKSFA